MLTFLELDAEFNVLSSSRHELDGYAYVHDFAFTANHYIVYNNPVDLDLLPLATGDKAPGQVSLCTQPTWRYKHLGCSPLL